MANNDTVIVSAVEDEVRLEQGCDHVIVLPLDTDWVRKLIDWMD
jgi:hypothetical protein